MDYFSVIVLVIVIFVFISDRKVKSIEDIKLETSSEVYSKIQEIKSNLEIIKVRGKDMEFSKLHNIIKNNTNNNINNNINNNTNTNRYLLFQNVELNLNSTDFDTLIANYINSKEKICGFNLLYKYSISKWSLKTIYIDIINYLNIFNKNDLSTYGVVICKKEDLESNKHDLIKTVISYSPSEITYIYFSKNKLKSKRLKKMYIKKISRADLDIILKIMLLIISGSIITTNLASSIFNIANNLNSFIVSLVIYYCYSYIIRYIYKPIGKKRIVATYIFPIYFLIYIIVGIYGFGTKVIKKYRHHKIYW